MYMYHTYIHIHKGNMCFMDRKREIKKVLPKIAKKWKTNLTVLESLAQALVELPLIVSW